MIGRVHAPPYPNYTMNYQNIPHTGLYMVSKCNGPKMYWIKCEPSADIGEKIKNIG